MNAGPFYFMEHGGERLLFDGAKDMFKYWLDVKKYHPSKSRGEITAVFVKDCDTREDIDARQAFYVVWSDTYGPMDHEPIPFATEAAAGNFGRNARARRSSDSTTSP